MIDRSVCLQGEHANTTQEGPKQGIEPSQSCSTDLRPIRDVFGAVSDEADGLHAGVREGGVAGKFGQTLDGILEGIDGGCKVLLKHIRWGTVIK